MFGRQQIKTFQHSWIQVESRHFSCIGLAAHWGGHSVYLHHRRPRQNQIFLVNSVVVEIVTKKGEIGHQKLRYDHNSPGLLELAGA
jgi:hypothetical protein